MFSYIDKIASLMSEADKKEYGRIFAPRIVLTPPMDARREMCVCCDGELRVYGYRDKTRVYSTIDDGVRVYFASRDGGLSWKQYDCKAGDIGPCVKVPWTGKYITVMPTYDCKPMVYLSDNGPGDTSPEVFEIPGIILSWDIFQPFVDTKTKQIFVVGYNRDNDGCYHPKVLVSRDGGHTFSVTELENPPRFELKPPHKGLRWENNGAEPSITRLPDGRLWIIIRTSQDYMYEYYSYDDGETWSAPAPTRFHMTLTTPNVATLSDGRVLLMWNNTQPMPEIDMSTFMPPISKETQNGVWEDVFTNRDIAHAAISEDSGKTFIGYRETYLNPLRNSNYFRSHGSFKSGGDKSAHQHQILELPYNKVLVMSGQHEAVRRMYIFDLNWLYETKREDRFLEGLEHVSTHGYLKSICEAHMDVSVGHCQWNRYNTVMPMPDPEGSYVEVMNFSYNDDPRLYNGISGMCWNFPIAKCGHIEISAYRASSGLRVSLNDVWINPSDETVKDYSKFTFDADEKVLPQCKWVILSIDFDCDKKLLSYSVDSQKCGEVMLQNEVVDGVCYLHLQTLARERDYKGTCIKKLYKK